MTVERCVQVVRRRWRAVLAACLLGVLIAAVFSALVPKVYAATISMYISAQTPDSATAAYQGGLLSQARATSYVELLDGPRVAGQVQRDLSLPYSVSEIQDQMQASTKLDSVLLDLRVTNDDPQTALAIAADVGKIFPGIVAEIERPTTAAQVPSVAVRLVQPPILGEDPVWPPGLALTLPVGAIIGFLVGIAIAFALDVADTRVRDSSSLASAAELSDLGVVVRSSEDPTSVVAFEESLRRVRANISFMRVDKPPQILMVTSALEGEGKTTVSIGLADALASAGNRVLLIDADMRRPSAYHMLGLERNVGLSSALSGQIDFAETIQAARGGRFGFVASGPTPPNPSEMLGSSQLASMLSEARKRFQYIVVDTAPTLPVSDSLAASNAVDGVILVAHHQSSNITKTRAAAISLRSVNAPLLGSLLNGVPMTDRSTYGSYQSSYLSDASPKSSAPDEELAITHQQPLMRAKSSGQPKHGSLQGRDR